MKFCTGYFYINKSFHLFLMVLVKKYLKMLFFMIQMTGTFGLL